MRTVIALCFLLSPAAFAGCLEEAGQRLIDCRQGCLSKWTEQGRLACATECNANYYAEKRACNAGGTFFADAADEDVCQIVRSEDGRLRALCTLDGTVYQTWGQCKNYCH